MGGSKVSEWNHKNQNQKYNSLLSEKLKNQKQQKQNEKQKRSKNLSKELEQYQPLSVLEKAIDVMKNSNINGMADVPKRYFFVYVKVIKQVCLWVEQPIQGDPKFFG